MAFSANHAALEGFRIIRREPLTLVVWAVAMLVFSLVYTALFMPMLAPLTALTPSGGPFGPQDPAMVPRMMAVMGRVYAIMIPVLLIFVAVSNAAVYRAVLRPGETGFGRLRLGGDELRLLGLYVLLCLLFFGVYLATIIVAVIVAAIAGMAFHSQSVLAFGAAIAGAVLLVLGVLVWMGVRLSLAGPMTFATGRLSLFKSWPLTKGRFWSLLGCYLLAFVIILVLYVVVMCLYLGSTLVAEGGSMTQATASILKPDMSSIQAYLTPARIAYIVLAAPLSAIMLAVGSAPPAAAYRDIVGDGTPSGGAG